ncbi:MAG TPA: polymer-forming cytoskeletal protein [Myxococcota bacterium]|nr:polymer-forming cytoskeletal protein [Myxococcota bacterium]
MALKDLMARTPAPEPIRPEPPAPVAPPRPAPPAPSAPMTHLGAGSVISGRIRCAESLRIDGQVKGEIFCDQLLTVGESASVQAAIEGDSVVIAGEVQGDITAHRKITLERTARVTGDLCTPGIVIQEGAILEGRIMIGGQIEEPRAAGAQPAAARPSEPSKPAPRPPSATPPPPQP